VVNGDRATERGRKTWNHFMNFMNVEKQAGFKKMENGYDGSNL